MLTDITINEVEWSTHRLRFRQPLKFGGRVMSESMILDVAVTVEAGNGKHAVGYGSMPIGNVWAWPAKTLEPNQTAERMLQLAPLIAQKVREFRTPAHPLLHGLSLRNQLPAIMNQADQQSAAVGGEHEAMPILAGLVVASPFDAALHDAYGRVHEQNIFHLLGKDVVKHDLADLLREGSDQSPECQAMAGKFKGEYLDQYTSREPVPLMPIYHLVGAVDPLDESEQPTAIDDDLPTWLGDWIRFNGLTHLKIKLNGDNLAWDVARVLTIDKIAEQTQAGRGCKAWWYSLDFNEKCPNVGYVLEFLAQVKAGSPAGFDRIQYIEQPTHRNLADHPENTMHQASAVRPVVIDESLVSLESLLLSRQLGYTGIALKACKGITESLLLAAVAQKENMFRCVQDLTCPGRSFLASSVLAARIPGVPAIEGNGRQYCPAGNVGWDARYPGMFRITNGTLATSCLTESGLGFSNP